MSDCKDKDVRGNRGKEKKTFGYESRDGNQPTFTSYIVWDGEVFQDGRDGSMISGEEGIQGEAELVAEVATYPSSRQGFRSLGTPRDAGCCWRG